MVKDIGKFAKVIEDTLLKGIPEVLCLHIFICDLSSWKETRNEFWYKVW